MAVLLPAPEDPAARAASAPLRTPYLLARCHAEEFSLQPLRRVSRTPLPRRISQPSTVWRDGASFYTSRVRQAGLVRW